MIDIFVILFFLVGLASLSLRSKKNFSNYISRTQSGNIEALLIYGVFLLHLSAYASSGRLLHYFFLLDNCLVGLFFFYSGYGLLTGYLQKGRSYTDGLLKRKLPKLLIPWVICAFAYSISYHMGMESTAALIDGASLHNTIEILGEWVANGWFVFVLILFYCFFVLSLRLAKDNLKSMILINFILLTIYILMMLKLHMGFWWYFRSYCFLLGLIWCAGQKKIDTLAKKFNLPFLIVFTLAMALLLILLKLGCYRAEYLLLPIFTIWVQLLSMKFVIDHPILQWLHKHQFSFYLIHGMALGLLRGNLLFIQNDFLYACTALLFALLGAVLLNFCSEKIIAFHN